MKNSKNSLDAAIRDRLGMTRAFRHGVLFLVACAILMPFIGLLGASTMGEPVGAGAMVAALPFLGMAGPLREADPGNPDGGGSDDEMARKILAKIDEAKKANEELNTKFAELDGDAKKMAEEYAKIAKNYAGLDSDIKAFMEQVKRIESKIANERRSNGMGALQRIQGDTELRSAINNAIRASYHIQSKRSEEGLPKEWLDAHRSLQAMQGKTITGGATPGSTYLNDALLPELYSLIAEFGVWSQFDVIRAGARTNKLLVDGADPVMGVVAEGVAPDESDPQGSTVSATVVKLLGWVGVARELLEDAETDVSGILMRKFANATAYRLDWFCTQADGGADATDGGMTGIFGGGATASVAAGGNVSIATLDFEDFIKPLTVVAPAVLTRGGARWWIHPTSLAKVIGLKDGNGRSIFLPSTDAPSFGAFGSILGFPISMTHAAPTADTTSTRVAVFGDPMGQAVLLRSDMEFVASDQAKFTEDEIVFRCRARAASRIRQATAFGALTTAAS